MEIIYIDMTSVTDGTGSPSIEYIEKSETEDNLIKLLWEILLSIRAYLVVELVKRIKAI